MNPLLERLQPYPFEKLRALLAGIVPNEKFKAINLSIDRNAIIDKAFFGYADYPDG